MNGMIMTAKVLLDKNPHPSVAEIKQGLNGNLCRCGSHLRVIRAVQRAANSSVKA
jgi:nicotinate dehydrogenase subunit A